jgi:hypothetical protein
VHASSPGEAGTATAAAKEPPVFVGSRVARCAMPPSSLYLTHESRYQARASHVETALRHTAEGASEALPPQGRVVAARTIAGDRCEEEGVRPGGLRHLACMQNGVVAVR